MIELTKQQVDALQNQTAIPLRLVNPRTSESFVLLRTDEYERLKESEYDDSTWTQERVLGTISLPLKQQLKDCLWKN